MVKLARAMVLAMVEDYGPREVLSRLSDPFWFQAFGCVLGFDWHSSGITTTVCGTLKEGLRGLEHETGLFIAGGKGRVSRQTPQELEAIGQRLGQDTSSHIYASRMSAKVDSTALQDGYHIYHHNFFLTANGAWAVVQQGMNEATRYARRYHWLGDRVQDFVCEPHAAICSQGRGQVLNLVAQESAEARRTIAQLAIEEKPHRVINDLERLKSLDLPHHHQVALEDINPKNLARTFLSTYERRPTGFEALIALRGVGPKALRALSLVADLVYGVASSRRDPALYSFAHGGKDGHPYPVNRENYDHTVHFLTEALRRAKVGEDERLKALRRLPRMWVPG